MPLAAYFLSHPASLIAHAAEVFVFGLPGGRGGAVSALAQNALKTVGIFGITADPNARHNPGARPAFDLLLSGWLLLGVVLALWKRSLSYLYAVAWLVIFALPAIFSDAAPHFLRTLPMVPAACFLSALAMLVVWAWLAAGPLSRARNPSLLAKWLPLPFVLFSGLLGVYNYFYAFSNPSTYPAIQTAFGEPFASVAPVVAEHGRNEGVCILPISPISDEAEPPDNAIDFLTGAGLPRPWLRTLRPEPGGAWLQTGFSPQLA